jgi:hypothetical protein
MSVDATFRPQDPLQRIRRLSHWLAWVCMALIVLLPLALFIFLLTANVLEMAKLGGLSGDAIQQLQGWQRWVAGGVASVPLAMLLMGLWQARCCFDLFAHGNVFTGRATHRLRRFAAWTGAATLAGPLAAMVNSVVLTLQNTPGTRRMAIGLGSDQLFMLLFAALVYLMADVIAQGQTLAEENERFV